MRKKAIAAFIVLLLVLLFASCQDKKGEPESIHLQPSSFLSAYTVDQEMDLDGVALLVAFPKGKYEDVPCTKDMIVGFDTSTTGSKELYAVYNGLTSNRVSYYVYNAEDVSREIRTQTRIAVTKTVSEGKTTFDFSLRSADIAVRALSFRITGNTDIKDGLTELVGTPRGAMNDFYWKKTATDSVNVLLSGPDPQTTGVFFTLEWEGEDRTVVISDVTVSDGTADYYLPIVQ